MTSVAAIALRPFAWLASVAGLRVQRARCRHAAEYSRRNEGQRSVVNDRRRAEQALGTLEARNSAVLRAIPDLTFMLDRDGTYVDYHARDSRLLFVPPDRVVGRTVRDVLPPDVARTMMEALERAFLTDDPVIVEYELSMIERRRFEARLVRTEHDRVLSVVRDVTDSTDARRRNRELAGRLITSQEAERTRLARDLHDGVCQDLASVTVDISYLRQKGAGTLSREVQEGLLSIERRAARIAEDVRLLSHGLHPSVLHHIGLVAALQAHCAEVERQHHLHVRFFADGAVEPASRLVALSLFRITQEALRNTARHGHARHATVSLERAAADLTLTVADDGGGFDLPAARRNGGLGLVSIEERARLIQGQVHFCTQPGRGTTIEVRVPGGMADEAGGPGSEQQPRGRRRSTDRPLDCY